MRKLLSLLILLLGASSAGAQIATEEGRLSYAYDVTSTSYIYCKYAGYQGNPFAGANSGPGLIKTTGSSQTVVENTSGTNPFTEIAVGDLLSISVAGNQVLRVVTARASAASITVDTAIDISGGTNWSWWRRSCGTTIDDGWVRMDGAYNVTWSRTIATINATSIQTQVECRLNNNPSANVVQTTDSSTTTGTWGYTLTYGAWDACRLGVKVTGDGGVQSVSAAVSVSRFTRYIPFVGGMFNGPLLAPSANIVGPLGLGNTVAAPHLYLYGDAANTLAQRNGGTVGAPIPQTFYVYNFCDGAACATGYERGGLVWFGNALYLSTANAGTGSARSINLYPADGTINAYSIQPASDDARALGAAALKWTNLYIARSTQGSKCKDLTEASATPIVQVAIPSGDWASFTVYYATYCADATNRVLRTGRIIYNCINTGGTETCNADTLIGPTDSSSGGATFSVHSISSDTSPTNAVNITVNATCSLTQTTLKTCWRLDMLNPQTVTPQ